MKIKPNYKKAALKYLDMYHAEFESAHHFRSECDRLQRDIKNLRQEISEWKGKYSDAMDKIIQLQEKLARVTKGEGNEQRKAD